ncbi:hypothetical protein [Uliginosibacterium gangwonense]|uniref:hypothetical protein n=1 Tax=Uliginosibacterium gangwonense TaxID=392736 RepID=UPI000365E8BE|nr:hypothetical protein [Uliginosibacterium gangwonense]
MQLRRERTALEQIHAEMESLSRLTRDVAGRVFYLQVHHRAKYGQMTLRWRTMGVKGVHIPWAKVNQYFERELPQMKAWYEEVHIRVLELNALEKSLRQQIKTKEHIAKFQ